MSGPSHLELCKNTPPPHLLNHKQLHAKAEIMSSSCTSSRLLPLDNHPQKHQQDQNDFYDTQIMMRFIFKTSPVPYSLVDMMSCCGQSSGDGNLHEKSQLYQQLVTIFNQLRVSGTKQAISSVTWPQRPVSPHHSSSLFTNCSDTVALCSGKLPFASLSLFERSSGVGRS